MNKAEPNPKQGYQWLQNRTYVRQKEENERKFILEKKNKKESESSLANWFQFWAISANP